jgi:photosystem I subunit 2
VQVEEFYVITWESNKEQIFEMPTGGAAIMRKGPNLLKLARKEQCLALTTQLRNKFKFTPCFYRVYPSGEVQYLHPKDGVYPEKVNAGRQGVNQNFRRIGDNVNPIKVGLAVWQQKQQLATAAAAVCGLPGSSSMQLGASSLFSGWAWLPLHQECSDLVGCRAWG